MAGLFDVEQHPAGIKPPLLYGPAPLPRYVVETLFLYPDFPSYKSMRLTADPGTQLLLLSLQPSFLLPTVLPMILSAHIWLPQPQGFQLFSAHIPGVDDCKYRLHSSRINAEAGWMVDQHRVWSSQ